MQNLNTLVPFVQNEEKWIKYYVKQAQKQVHPDDMTKPVPQACVRQTLVSPTEQVMDQVKSEVNKEKKLIGKGEVYAPIKAVPEFVGSDTSVRTPTQRTTLKRKRSNVSSSSSTSSKRKKCYNKDIFS